MTICDTELPVSLPVAIRLHVDSPEDVAAGDCCEASDEKEMMLTMTTMETATAMAR